MTDFDPELQRAKIFEGCDLIARGVGQLSEIIGQEAVRGAATGNILPVVQVLQVVTNVWLEAAARRQDVDFELLRNIVHTVFEDVIDHGLQLEAELLDKSRTPTDLPRAG